MPVARLSPAVETDIEGIWDYSERRWGHPQAVRYVRDLDTTFIGIAEGRISSLSAEDILGTASLNGMVLAALGGTDDEGGSGGFDDVLGNDGHLVDGKDASDLVDETLE